MAIITSAVVLSVISSIGGAGMGAVQDYLKNKKVAKEQEVNHKYELERDKLRFEQNLTLADLTQETDKKNKKIDLEIARLESDAVRFKEITKSNNNKIQDSASQLINFASFLRASTRPILTYLFFFLTVWICIDLLKDGVKTENKDIIESLITSIQGTMAMITSYWFYRRGSDKQL